MNALLQHVLRDARPFIVREPTQSRSRLIVKALVGVAAIALTLGAATPVAAVAQEGAAQEGAAQEAAAEIPVAEELLARELLAADLPADRVVVKFKDDVSRDTIEAALARCRSESDGVSGTQNLLSVRAIDVTQGTPDVVACLAGETDLVDWARPSPVVTGNDDGPTDTGDSTLVLEGEGGVCASTLGDTPEGSADTCVQAAAVDLFAYVLTPATTLLPPTTKLAAVVATAPAPNKCQIFSTIMTIAGKLDVVGAAFAPVDAVATIGGISAVANKLLKEVGEKVTKDQVKEVLADLVKDFLKDQALDAAKDLLGDPFNTGAACRALAQCETSINGNNVGKHVFYNAFGREMAKCVWRAPNVNYKRLGFKHRLGLLDFDDEP